MYLIWSEEHGAWWTQSKWSYTRSIAEAGRFDQTEADRIVRKGNLVVHSDEGMNLGRKWNEVMIPDPFWPCED